MIKMKLSVAVLAYRTLFTCSCDGLQGSSKIKIVKILKSLQSKVEDYESLENLTKMKLRPSSLDSFQEGSSAYAVEFAKFQQELNKALTPELNKDCEFSFPLLTEEEFSALLDYNNWHSDINKLLFDYFVEC